MLLSVNEDVENAAFNLQCFYFPDYYYNSNLVVPVLLPEVLKLAVMITIESKCAMTIHH